MRSFVTVSLIAGIYVCLTACVWPRPLFTGRLAMQSAETDNLIARADAARQEGNVGEAERLLRQAVTLGPQSTAANNALGNLLLANQRYADAMQSFETVLLTSPLNKAARVGEEQAVVALALTTRNAGNNNEALAHLQRARTFLPDDLTVLTDLGILAQSMHQLSLASEALARALDLNPQDTKTLYAMARVEMDQEHFADADQHLRAYLAQRPNDASAHYGRGHLLQMQLRTDEARAEFERSIALQPLQTESYYQIGQMALNAGHDDEASRMFEKTLIRMPLHGGALTGQGILAYRGKKYDSAREVLLRAVQSSPDYQPAHYYLGLTLARLGDKEGSAHELKTAEDLAVKQQGKGQSVPASH